MERVKILGIGGSLRAASRTRNALQVALDSAAIAGADAELFDLRDHALPLYDDRKDTSTYPTSVFLLLEKVRRADALILATPVYHGTPSGAMKNALDFFELLANDEPPWLTGKVTGLIAVAGGGSGTNAINGLLHTCHALRSWVLPKMAVIPGGAFNAEARIEEKKYIERLQRIGRDVALSARSLSLRDT